MIVYKIEKYLPINILLVFSITFIIFGFRQ